MNLPKFFLLVSSFLLVFFLFPIFASADSLPTSFNWRQLFSQPNIISGQAIVKYKNKFLPEVIHFQPSNQTKILTKLSQDSSIQYFEPNYRYQANIIPSDSYFSNQWYLEKIKAPRAWDKQRQSSDIIIAVIDTGVQITHPDLRANIWTNQAEIPGNHQDDDHNGYIDDVHGWDFITNTADPEPKFGQGFTEEGIMHGTIVAGIAAAVGNNAAGISGVTWRAQIMPLRVLDSRGEGSTADVVRAVYYAINNGADIINFSFTGFGNSLSLRQAIRDAHRAGVIIVAAAGNEQAEGNGYDLDEKPMYPVCHDGPRGENWVVGVAATDDLDQKADFSSYGFHGVDLAAPGVSVFSTAVYAPNKQIDGQYFNKYYDGYWSGTSVATPMVAGAIALIEQANPRLNSRQVVSLLLENTDNINRLNPSYLGRLGRGRLNVFAAVQAALDLRHKNNLVVSPFSAAVSEIKIIDPANFSINQFFAYNKNFRGGVNIAAGDIDGDGKDEIITGAGPGGGPHVRIFSANGKVLNQFFAYNKNFRGGVNIAAGDIDGDGKDEIITGAGPGGGPHVRIFSANGKVLNQFFAYNKNFRGGVNIAAGDIDGDGKDEIITGAGPGGGPHVRIFSANGKVLNQFFAYNKNFRGGVQVAAGYFLAGADGGRAQIITGAGPGGGPHVRIFSANGKVLNQFFAYNKNFRGGVNIAAGDIDGDGKDEIITGAGPGGGPHVRIFSWQGILESAFYAFSANFTGGINVNAGVF